MFFDLCQVPALFCLPGPFEIANNAILPATDLRDQNT